MSERGGATNQSGILYQNSVAALYLGRLLDSSDRPLREQVRQVRVEAPTSVDDTVVTFADRHREYIQAKENIRQTDEAWTKLWRDFHEQFNNSDFQRGKDKLIFHVGLSRKEHEDLAAACERAQTSPTTKEWFSRLTAHQEQLVRRIKAVLPAPDASNAHLHGLLAHLDVTIYSLAQIEKYLVPYLIPKSNRLPIEFFRLLRDRTGGEARRRGSFTLETLLGELKQESPDLEIFKQPALNELLELVKRSGSELKQHKNVFGSTSIHLKRQVTSEIVNWVNGAPEKNVALLLDQAGMGKTVVMRDVLQDLENSGNRVLAIKADQLSGIKDKADLQNKLGLPDTVERVLQRLVLTGKTVLLIDQIDALSLSLAHDQEALNILLELVAQVRFTTSVKIIVSCRVFDFNNDPRLAKIEIGSRFNISPLADDELASVLTQVGLLPETLSPATKKLLETPLHLDLFVRAISEISDSPASLSISSIANDLNNLQDLYSLLWQNVVCKTESGAPSRVAREEVLRLVMEEMNRKQRVSVPQSLVTMTGDKELTTAALWLASHGILIPFKNEWNLLHQTFFDYCYAKNFVENNEQLYETIVKRDQGLFVRPQVIQVLNYLRGVETPAYLKELSQFLFSTEIRFHLRDHVMRWFAALPNPTDEEWILARRLIRDAEQKRRFLVFVSGNSGWFNRLKPLIIRALETQDDITLDNETIPFLRSFAQELQAEVAGILRPYLKRGESWNRRIHQVLLSIREWREKEAVALLEDYFNHSLSFERLDYYEIKQVADFDAKAACRLIRRVLDDVTSTHQTQHQQTGLPFLGSIASSLEVLNGSSIVETLELVAKSDAKYFLEQILPWLETVLHSSENGSAPFPFFVSDQLCHYWDDGTYVVHLELIQALGKALVQVAGTDETSFRDFALRLSSSPYLTPQRLLARAYARLPEKYAGEAFVFLSEDVRRLYLGDREVFDSRNLVKAIAPLLQGEQVNQLEAAIFSLSKPGTFRELRELTYRHLNQMFLLQSFSRERLSFNAQSRLAELERKFPGVKASDSPSLGEGGFVGSPIAPDAIEKMSDKAWLRAMSKYSKGYEHKEFLKGGAPQLSGLLMQQVKANPERFYRLALQSPVDLEPAYITAFLNGLAEAEIPAEKFFEVFRRFIGTGSSEAIATSLARALEQRAKENVPGDLLEMVENMVRGVAREDETSWQRTEQLQGGKGFYDGLNRGPYISYLNSERGAAFHAVMRILDARDNSEALARKWQLIEFVVADSSVALKAGAIEELLYLLGKDRERCLVLFERMVEQDPVLLNTRVTLDFIFYSLATHYQRVHRFIVAAMNENYEFVQQRAAELACLATLYQNAAENQVEFDGAAELANSAVAGQATWKRGAARIYVANIKDKPVTKQCVERLIELINEPDKEVQRILANTFGQIDEIIFYETQSLVERYVASEFPAESERELAEFLWEQGVLEPEWSLSIINKILNHRYQTNDYLYYRNGEYYVRLALRIYTDPTLNKSIRENALDIFDRLMFTFTGDTLRVLNEWDER